MDRFTAVLKAQILRFGALTMNPETGEIKEHSHEIHSSKVVVVDGENRGYRRTISYGPSISEAKRYVRSLGTKERPTRCVKAQDKHEWQSWKMEIKKRLEEKEASREEGEAYAKRLEAEAELAKAASEVVS